MSKDYRGALYYLMTETVAYNDNKLIPLAKQALDDLQELVKRNEPVKLLKEKKYLHEFEWYTVFGKCPLCGHYNPSTANYCGNCGQALEKFDWSDEK